jgi:hypothetical protein
LPDLFAHRPTTDPIEQPVAQSGSEDDSRSARAFTGADPGDFNVSTTTCGASLGAKSTCTISVVFNPTATGKRTATLNVNDGANNSPQTVALTGTGD